MRRNNWNPEQHQAKMKPAIDRLISHFQKKGISFSPTDEHRDNVVFRSGNDEVKISHHSFYRYSGFGYIYKENKKAKKGEDQMEVIRITDDMFVDIFMKPIVEVLFEAKRASKVEVAEKVE